MTTYMQSAEPRPEQVSTYAVTLACDSEEQLDDLAIRFYDRYDGLLSMRDRSILVTQFVEETTAFRAGRQAVQDVESIGLSVRKVDRDLVDTPEIAKRLELSRQAVNLWADGKRSDGFPQPLGSPGGKRIWAWSQIVEWCRTHDKALDEFAPLSLDDCARLDVWLLDRRAGKGLRSVGSTMANLESGGDKGHYANAGSQTYQQSPASWLLER